MQNHFRYTLVENDNKFTLAPVDTAHSEAYQSYKSMLMDIQLAESVTDYKPHGEDVIVQIDPALNLKSMIISRDLL